MEVEASMLVCKGMVWIFIMFLAHNVTCMVLENCVNPDQKNEIEWPIFPGLVLYEVKKTL